MKAVYCKALCFVLVIAAVLASMSSCTLKKTDAHTAALNQNMNPASAAAGEWHYTSFSDLVPVASSGLIRLFYDTRTGSVAVYDTSSDYYWTALPVFGCDSAAMLNAVIVSENGRYYLNSQDHAVAYSSYSSEFYAEGIRLTYVMSDSESVARKAYEELQPGELQLCVTLDMKLTDGSLIASIDCAGVRVSDGYILESLTLMPYFGAVSYAPSAQAAEAAFYPGNTPAALLPAETAPEEETTGSEPDSSEADEDGNDENASDTENGSENADAADDTPVCGDFLLVPDGCGAVMYTAEQDASTDRVSFKVYGDEALGECKSAQLPAFGIKKNDSAFAAVIGEGACGAVIKANRGSADLDSVNKVCAEFPMTPFTDSGDKLYYSDLRTDPISVCYRFMSRSEANYISMAASCREYLIRLGLLSSRTVSYDEMPVNVEVIGSVDGGFGTLASGLEECEDMLGVIKAKGINSVNLILQGFFRKGLLQDSGSEVSPMTKTDGNRAFEALCEYAAKQKFNVFAGLNILTADSESDAALTLTGKSVTAALANPLYPYIGKASYPLTFLAADKIEKNVISLMNSARGLDLSGFCINDAASYAYADHSQNGASAQALSSVVAENVSSFAIRNKLMLDGCHFSVLKNASFLLDVPFHTQYEENEAYRAVPFIPAILHSTVGYSSEPVNISELPKLEMLKCIEYAGIPYFRWVFSMKSHLYYGLNLNESVEFVLRAAEDLSDLSGARISSHEMVEEGVYATGFDSGSVLYVNYNNYSVSVGNITVLPYDYIRLN